MDPLFYNAAITGNSNFLGQNKEKIKAQLTPDKKTVLHLASQLGQREAVKLILSMQPRMINEVNSFGETALHLATRGGHAGVVLVLLNHARKFQGDIQSTEHMWHFTNNDKETALHEAARYNRTQVLSMLVKEDPEYSHLPNKMGETPLYIAANRGFYEAVDVILKNCEAPSYSGPNGTTALHGAVVCGSEECTIKLLEWNTTIVKETDSNGQSPLHYAAYYGFSSIACQLLCIDASAAYLQTENYSETALHVAAIKGHVSVMKEILLQSPDCCSMVNIYGRNMLHLAIENNQTQVVEYILEECPEISSLINQKDVDGNTPSHLQAISNCYVPKLIEHAMTDKGSFNNKIPTHIGSEYRDIEKITKAQNEEVFNSSGGTLGILNGMNQDMPEVHKKEVPEPAPRKHASVSISAHSFDKLEQIRKLVNSDIIVAALIVTVTFTAGFTMPGGFIQSGSPNQGMAVLSKSVAFQAFIISDTLGLLFSISAIFLYSLTADDEINERKAYKLYTNGGSLTILALIATMLAFITGTYAVLAHALALAVTTCFLGCMFFLLIVFLCYTSR